MQMKWRFSRFRLRSSAASDAYDWICFVDFNDGVTASVTNMTSGSLPARLAAACMI